MFRKFETSKEFFLRRDEISSLYSNNQIGTCLDSNNQIGTCLVSNNQIGTCLVSNNEIGRYLCKSIFIFYFIYSSYKVQTFKFMLKNR